MTGMRRTPLCLALLASLAACTADGGSDEDPPSPTPTATVPATFAEPPDGAEVTVAETGFSATPSEEEAADILSYGVVVENTSDEFVALDSTVSISLLDSDGNPIDEISGEPTDQPARRQSVTRLLPGERIGFGGTVPHHGAEVADLAVDVETATWAPVAADRWWSQSITASDVTTQDTTGASVLRFAVDAAYTQEMVGGELVIGGHFTAIFRDSAGAVVGGADCCHDAGGNAPVEVPPGQSEGQLTLDFGTPAGADDARTEVYLPDPRENLPG
jgi:hypothetical protein